LEFTEATNQFIGHNIETIVRRGQNYADIEPQNGQRR
jgi:hypothetical protein